MKILCLTHTLKTDITDDFAKALEYHRQHGIEFTVEYQETTATYDEFLTEMLSIHGYTIVVYAYNREDYPLHYYPFTPPYDLETSIIRLPVEKNDQIMPNEWLWKAIAHELMHALANRLQFKYGTTTTVNAVMDTYIKNTNPYAPDGNFARSWAILQPYISTLSPTKSMNTVTIQRSYTDKETFGTLTASRGGAHFMCKTVELPWKNNTQSVSCIPKGTYTCKWTFSPKFRKYTYQVMNVPNRTGIRIHSANYFFELEGCIALGSALVDINHDGEVDTINSRVTVSAFNGFMGKEDFQLTIS